MSPLFRKKEAEEIEEELDEEMDIEDLYIKVRFRPSPNHGWKHADDVEPPLELVDDLFFGSEEISKSAEEELRDWLSEEFGGGYWKIELIKNGKTLRSRTIHIDDTDIIYGVNKWIVYVKGESGRWYKADAEFVHLPTATEIIDQIGGGGSVRVVGYDERGRIVSSKTMNINVPIPDWVLEREDSFERKMREALKNQIVKQQEKLLSTIAGDGGQQTSNIDRVIAKLEELVEEKKLEGIQKIINALEGEAGKEEKKSLSDTLFIEPYKAKVRSLTLLIEKFAEKGDIETARMLLNEIPDGSSALISLMSAGANLANAIASMLAGSSQKEIREKFNKMVEERAKQRRGERSKPKEEEKKEIEQKEVEQTEEKKEEAETTEERKVTEEKEKESEGSPEKVVMEEGELKEGWEIKLKVET